MFRFLLIMLLSVAAAAQTPAQLEKGVKNLNVALQNEREPVVASALFHLVKLKTVHPGQDISEALPTIRALADSSDRPAIRYQAALALQYLNQSALADAVPVGDFPHHEAFFLAVSEVLQESLVVNR